MSFQEKNFNYVTKPFGTFVNEILAGSRQYLRSVSSVEPLERPTELAIDFPELAGDFRLPPQLDYVTRNAHSSPLRISSDVAMWLHYDVSAQMLSGMNMSHGNYLILQDYWLRTSVTMMEVSAH